MQLPVLVTQACLSVFRSANVATTSYVGLTASNANVIEKFGSPVQRARYLQALRSGRFFGTMALTEPQAGSSLSDLRTSATPRSDGSYLLKGLWIVIGAGRCRRPRCHHADKGGSEAGWESDDAGSAR